MSLKLQLPQSLTNTGTKEALRTEQLLKLPYNSLFFYLSHKNEAAKVVNQHKMSNYPPPQGYPPPDQGYPKDAYPPPGYPAQGGYPPPPQHGGYPPQGYAPPQYAPQYGAPPPPQQEKKQVGFMEGCLAALCCCCVMDACFDF